MATLSAVPRISSFSLSNHTNSRTFPQKNPPKILNFYAQKLHNRHNVNKSLSPISVIDTNSKFLQVGHSARPVLVKSSSSDASATSNGLQSVCNIVTMCFIYFFDDFFDGVC